MRAGKEIIVVMLLFAAAAQAQLAPNAPADKPIGTDAEELQEIEKRIVPLIEEARRTFPAARDRYLKGLPPRHVFFVTTVLTDSQGRREQVFIEVKTIKEGRISGKIANEIRLVSGYRTGDEYTLPEGEIRDWLISKPDGSEEGNVIGKFLDTYQR
jgi:hypothetical protein